MDYPAEIATFTVTGSLWYGNPDTEDAGIAPNLEPIRGASVLFEPDAETPIFPAPVAKGWIYQRAVPAATDYNGQITGMYDSSPDVMLPYYPGQTWKMTVSVPDFPDRVLHFTGSAGGVVNLGSVVPVPMDPGTDIIAWQAVVAQVTADATAAAASAAAAAASNPGVANGTAQLDGTSKLKSTQVPTRLTDTGLAASLANTATPEGAAIASVAIQVREAPLTPYRYGAVAPIAGSNNTTALSAMFAAAAGTTYTGSEIYIPPGLWRHAGAALPITNGMKIRGAGRGKSRISTVTGAGNLFEWNTGLSGVQVEDLWLESTVAGKGIFAPGASGGLFASTFKKLFMVASTDTSWIYQQNNGASFIHNTVQDCELQRTATSTVVPFSIINTGGGANFNQFNQVRMNGLNNVTTPFLHVESTLVGTYLTDWTLINILGEQNPGGLIRVLGAFNWTVINATDEDSTVDYAANIIDFKQNSLGLMPRDITIIGSGRRGRAMVAGKYDIAVETGGRNVAIINCDPTPTSGTTLLSIPKTSTVTGVSGYPQQYQGSGSPEAVVAAVVGSTYLRTDGGASTTFYVKESGGSANTGWVAK